MINKNKNHKMPKEALKLVSYCPLCHTYFNLFQAKLVEQSTDTYLMHLVCHHCQSSIVMLVLSSNLGVSSFGLITDLTFDDVIRFRSNSEVTSDDVIEIFQILKTDNFWSKL